MVTLLKPDNNQADTGYQETTAIKAQELEHNAAGPLGATWQEIAQPQPQRRGTSGQRSNANPTHTGFISGIAYPLLALYRVASGPPMTQRDRNHREVRDATRRNSASLNWLGRAPW